MDSYNPPPSQFEHFIVQNCFHSNYCSGVVFFGMRTTLMPMWHTVQYILVGFIQLLTHIGHLFLFLVHSLMHKGWQGWPHLVTKLVLSSRQMAHGWLMSMWYGPMSSNANAFKLMEVYGASQSAGLFMSRLGCIASVCQSCMARLRAHAAHTTTTMQMTGIAKKTMVRMMPSLEEEDESVGCRQMLERMPLLLQSKEQHMLWQTAKLVQLKLLLELLQFVSLQAD